MLPIRFFCAKSRTRAAVDSPTRGVPRLPDGQSPLPFVLDGYTEDPGRTSYDLFQLVRPDKSPSRSTRPKRKRIGGVGVQSVWAALNQRKTVQCPRMVCASGTLAHAHVHPESFIAVIEELFQRRAQPVNLVDELAVAGDPAT